MKVFYNPACSKCRRVRALLDERSEAYVLVEYLSSPPDRDCLRDVVTKLDTGPESLVRRDERFAELGLDEADCTGAERVLDLLEAHPELLERPVAVRGDRALVARPPERVLELLD